MNIINYFQDSSLVACIQNWFGVIVLERNRERIKKETTHKFIEQSNSNWLLCFNDGMVGSNNESEPIEKELNENNQEYRIENRFWFYLFQLATKTGDELFYSLFFPFWKWNVDGSVFRRVIYMWMITMYFGQALKDLLKIPRPRCPPVVQLDTKWRLEYGLPSTHAMVSCVVPFSLFILCVNRYQLNYSLGFTIALIWCITVSISRIYLGMHSVLDILCGWALSVLFLVVVLPWITTLDYFMLTNPLSPLLSIVLSVAMVVCYPSTDRWTPARGDTTVIIGFGCGCLLGSWLNYQLGIIYELDLKPPFTVVWPSLLMIIFGILRTITGSFLIGLVRTVFKSISCRAVCAFLQVNVGDYENSPSKVSANHRLTIELSYKFFTYLATGLTIVFVAPLFFHFMHIERPMFHTEF